MFWLIGLLIGGNIFFAAMFWQAYRAYKESDRQFWQISKLCEERLELIDNAHALLDRYKELALEQNEHIASLEQECSVRLPENITQYPN